MLGLDRDVSKIITIYGTCLQCYNVRYMSAMLQCTVHVYNDVFKDHFKVLGQRCQVRVGLKPIGPISPN